MSSIRRSLWFTLPVFFWTTAVQAEQVTLRWDRNPEPNISSYIVSYGTDPRGLRPYTATVDVGNQTQWVFTRSNVQDAYYFAVQARNSSGLLSGYSAEVILEPQGGLPVPPGSSDINGDGRADLLWQHQGTGVLSAWFMNGTSLAGASALSPAQVTDTNWKIVGTGDFNRDGHADLFWQHQVTRLMGIWYMNGTQFVGPGLLSNNTVSDTNWEIRAIGDMNGDAWPDLVWQHRAQGSIVVWIMNGTTLVAGKALSAGAVSDLNWKIVGAADFNGDQLLDLVWHNQATGTLSVWQMNGTNLVSGRAIYPTSAVADTDWQIAGIIDLNGDTMPDLIWQHRTAGWISAWLMNGTATMRTTLMQPSQVSDLLWRIVGPN
jgi:hypothetical protein